MTSTFVRPAAAPCSASATARSRATSAHHFTHSDLPGRCARHLGCGGCIGRAPPAALAAWFSTPDRRRRGISGHALAPARDDVVVATKFMTRQSTPVRRTEGRDHAGLDASLARLGTDRREL
jgi:hypothetical protein